MIYEPFVSVLMTSYNREKYISEAIESVLASTFSDFELIIVDDCSTDSTVEIAKSYEVKDSRVSVFVNEENLGDYQNRNRAAGYAKGQLLVSVDSDDKIYDDAISYIVEGFNKYPDACFGIINSDINELKLVKRSYELKKPDELIKSHFFKSPTLVRGPGASVIKKEFFYRIGCFPTLYGPANDMFYNLVAASRTETIIFGYHFLFYRVHGHQERNNEKSYIVNNFNYLKEYILNEDIILSNEEKRYILKNNARRFVLNTLKYVFQKLSIIDFIGFYKKVNISWKDLKSLF